MEKEIKITQELSNQVEGMVIAVQNVSEIAKKYPKCWEILRHQFKLKEYGNNDVVEDDINNVKIRLYAEIITKNTVDKKKLEAEVSKQIKK